MTSMVFNLLRPTSLLRSVWRRGCVKEALALLLLGSLILPSPDWHSGYQFWQPRCSRQFSLAGRAVVCFEYRPTSLVIGAIACLFGLAVTIIIQVPRLREMGCRLKRSS
jgi:hypothetical protein